MPAELELLLRARYPLVWLVTPEEQRAVDIACRVARSLGDPVVAWSSTWGLHDAPGPPVAGKGRDPLDLLEHIRKETKRSLWILKDLPALLYRGDNAALVRALRDTAVQAKEQGSTILCIGNMAAVPSELEGEAAVHRLRLPDQREHQTQLLAVARQLGVHVADAPARELSQACLGLTLEQGENIWARVRAAGGQFTLEDVEQVLAEKRRIVRSTGFLEFVNPVDIDEVGGLQGLKHWLQRRSLGFSEDARRIGLPWPRGMLMVGVQGCGKSLVSKAIAGSWRQPLLRMDVGALMEGLVGASEQNLRRALDLAERVAPCVLWVDEIEKAFSGMSAGTDGGTIMRMFGTMLTWMQEKDSPVFVVATANDVEGLPPEFLRKGRFDEVFFVDLPDELQRRAIWKVHLAERARRAGDDGLLDRVAIDGLVGLSAGYSGAEIAAAVVEGAFEALAEGERLDGTHLARALSSSPPLSRTRAESIDKLREWARGRTRSAS
ncbi:MAG: AAA family ATPase [Alphaproteobacteria bacterium]|nr:AAA family ATPase [Alphaproteobacteria bacterium]